MQPSFSPGPRSRLGFRPAAYLDLAGPGRRSCLALHRAGFAWPPRHRDAGALLPHHFTFACARLTCWRAIGRLFLWHFPAGFPGWALPTALALWCPDFPRGAFTSRDCTASGLIVRRRCGSAGTAAGLGELGPAALAAGLARDPPAADGALGAAAARRGPPRRRGPRPRARSRRAGTAARRARRRGGSSTSAVRSLVATALTSNPPEHPDDPAEQLGVTGADRLVGLVRRLRGGPAPSPCRSA